MPRPERTERFELRLSKDEYALLQKKSADLGVSAADYLRILINGVELTVMQRKVTYDEAVAQGIVAVEDAGVSFENIRLLDTEPPFPAEHYKDKKR